MNQKKCPQCKNFILLTAPTCLYCGRPNKFVTENYVRKKWKIENSKNKNNKIFNKNLGYKLIIIIFIISFILLLIKFYR